MLLLPPSRSEIPDLRYNTAVSSSEAELLIASNIILQKKKVEEEEVAESQPNPSHVGAQKLHRVEGCPSKGF